MATSTLLSITDQRNGTQWTDSWSGASSVTRIYCGPTGDTGSYALYRNRITFNTNNVIISSSSKLVIECKVREQSYYCSALKARLSQATVNPNDYYKYASWTNKNYVVSDAVTNATILASSAFKDSSGSTGIGGSSISKDTSIYFVFNLNNVIKQNQTYYIYLAQESTSGNYFTALDVIGITLTHETYTKCGAPSSVSLNGYIVPNGSFTVSWGAGTAGNANNITGYRIYCKSTSSVSSPSTSDKYFDVGKDNRSLTISASEITNGNKRGYYITCAVQTLGSAGSTYYSDLKTHSGGVTINTLPKTDSMSVAASKTILPSTGGSVTFTVSGATDDHHSISYAYATSATGTKKLISGNSVSLTISKNTTVYFWAYDGFEYSEDNKSRTIQINTQPTCKIEATSAAQITTSSTVPSGYKYVLSPAFEASKSNTTLGSSNSFTHYYRVYDSSKKLIEEKKYNATGATHSISDIRNVIAATPPFYYQFGATVNDGIEESDKIWGDQYYVTGAPGVQRIYNTVRGENVTGMGQYSSASTTNPFYFSKEMCIDFVYDAGYENKTFTLSTSKSAQVKKVDNYLRAIFNDCGVTSSGTYKPQGYFLTKTSYSVSASRSLYKIKPFEIIFSNITECSPYTNNNITVSIASNNLNSSANPKEFGINADSIKSISSFSGTLKYQGETSSVGILNISSSEDNMVFESFSYDNDSAFQLNQNKSHTVTFVLNFTNSFGDKYSGSKDFKINYKETPKITGVNIILPNEGTNYVKEGQEIIFQVDYENCHNSNQKLKIESQYGFETYSNVISKIMGIAEITAVVPKILSHKELSTLTFSITNDAGTNCFKDINKNIIFLKHDTPNVILTRSDYNDQDKELTVYFSPSDWGLDPILQTAPGDNEPDNNIEISLEAQNGKKTLSFKYDKNLKSCTFNQIKLSESDNWESKSISLKIKVTSYTYSETTHTQEKTNEILVYNSTPTVAYRKNQLGINTKDPTGREEALVVIGGASGRNQIFYETNQEKPYCQVINFQFNGGVWGSDLDNDDIGVIVGELPSAEQNSF